MERKRKLRTTSRTTRSSRRQSTRLKIFRLASFTGITSSRLSSLSNTSKLYLLPTKTTSKREQSDYLPSETAAVRSYYQLLVSIVKKTIIFDLDETLVHCIDDIENNPCDQVINVTFPNGETV